MSEQPNAIPLAKMNDVNAGGPAFPGEDATKYWRGMSLRDWFAGQALAGYFAAPNTPHQNCAAEEARYIYRMADAMLAERVKATTP